MVSLEPVELLDHHRAGRKCVPVLVWESARQENLGKARIRSRLARIPGGGNDEVVDHVSGAHGYVEHASWQFVPYQLGEAADCRLLLVSFLVHLRC
jgi:hypothetical protein